MKYLLMIFLILAVACSTGNKACTEEAKLCPDGSAVGRNSANNCEFDPCPASDVTYMSKDPERCKLVKFMCDQGKTIFSDETGCGCKPEETNGKLKAIECTAEQRNLPCTKEYMPVCGWFNQEIKCLVYPCAANYGNKCTACSDEKVASWTEGNCPKSESVLKSSCESNGGRWVGPSKECEGINASICEEIGGNFNECASACRNNPDAQVCTMQCVLVCQFST
jgi:hypothetical protein